MKSTLSPHLVMPALVAGIHVFAVIPQSKTWMAGTKPGHDKEEASFKPLKRLAPFPARLSG